MSCPDGTKLVTDIYKCFYEVPKWAQKPISPVPAGCFKLDAIGCFTNGKAIAFSRCKHPKGTNVKHEPVCEKIDGKSPGN